MGCCSNTKAKDFAINSSNHNAIIVTTKSKLYFM